jgi:antitoxin HicB
MATMHFAWPIEIQEEPEGFTVTFPDVPGAVTWGETRAEAMERAEDALVSVISAMIEDGQAVPLPSAPRGRPKVSVPPLDAAKIALHDAMLKAHMSNVELAHRMGLDEKAVRRLRDPLQRSHIETVAAALRVLGKKLELSVFEIA